MSPAVPSSAPVADVLAARRQLLTSILRDEEELRADEEVVEVRQLEGGWSRWSHIAVAKSHAGERRYVVRVKAPFGLFDTDLALEYDVFRGLEGIGIPTPRAFGLHESPENPFGGEFFVMEHLPGHAPNLWRAKDHAALREDWEGSSGIATDLVTYLARIHAVGPDRAPASLPRVDYPGQLSRWRRVYQEYHLVRDPIVEEAFAWLAGRTPADAPVGIVHGDWRVGNTLIEAGHVTAILDWELAYVGDVRFDVGYFALEYTAGRHLRPKTALMGGAMEHEWFFGQYEQLTGSSLNREVVRSYSVLGLAALITMAYVGVRQYAEGRTRDVRRVWARYGTPGMREELTRLMDW
ncbi:MAG: phosphotransferase family protein [Thermoleophilaceae bacterium]